jgi:hypothetical protein
MFAAKLQAYLPGGASAGELPLPIHWEASFVHNDVGALTVDYSTKAAGGALIARPIDDGLEVAVEIWNGLGNWVESKGCRFVRVKQNVDQADESQVYRVTFASYGWLLMKARILEGTGTTGVRTFVTPKVGPMLTVLLGENAARDGIPMTIVGGGTNDANGVAWPTLADIPFNYGLDYLSILRGLQETGAVDWTTQARGVYAYLADSTALSPDLSATIRLDLGRDITEAPADETLENLAGRVGVTSEHGGVVVVEEPTAPSPHGVWENHLAVQQATDEDAAISMGEHNLETTSKAKQQYTRALVVHEGAPIPMIDYWQGCWITAPTGVLAEKVRVQQVTITYGKDGYGASVVLNDRLIEDDIRRGRTLGSIAGGQVGSSGPPPPVAVDPEASRVPSTPTGLNAVASLVFDPVTGAPQGVVDASWNAVTTATDTGPLDISGYSLQYRVGAGPWQNIGTPELSARITGLLPGNSVDTRVRANGARTTLPSAWSAIDNVVVSGDVTPPSVPSVPSLISRLGIVTVVWDGLTNIGGAMQDDFAYAEIAMADSTTPTTVVGKMSGAGMAPIPDQTIGENRQVRLRSVDTSGNASAWSVVTDPIVVHGVTGPDLEADSVTANAILAGSLTGDLFAALMVISSMYTTSATGTGQRVEWDINGIRLYNSLDELRVNLPTDPSLDAYFQGEVHAEGLTVTGGATFRSTQNEFAPDSLIALADSVTAPVGAPNVTPFWSSTQLQNVVVNDVLGNFGLDMSQIQSAAWNHTINQFHLVQKVPTGGARVWYYTIGGSYSTHWDLPDQWDVSSVGVGLDGEFRILYKYASKWWIYDYSRAVGSRDREYTLTAGTGRPFLTMEEGTNNIYITEVDGVGDLKTRRVTTNTTPVTVAATTVMTGISPPSGNIAAVYRGTADFSGVTKHVVSHKNALSYRHFSTAGVYQPEWSFNPPTSKVGGFWNPSTSQFYTIGGDGKLYTHSTLMWTSSTLDTWHLGQTFRDSVGTTHETVVGAFRTFNPTKRAWQRVVPATVPYAGGADDPNQWRLYGKTGTAPDAIGTGTTLQVTGAYTVTKTDMGTLLSTGGSAPPSTSNFPAANPARLQSAARLPSDSTKAIIDLRGDGFGRFGPLEVSSAAVLTDTRDVDWTATGIVYSSNWESLAVSPADNCVEFTILNRVLYLSGLVRRAAASATLGPNTTALMFTLPVGARPLRAKTFTAQTNTVFVTGGASAGTAHTHAVMDMSTSGPSLRVQVASNGEATLYLPPGVTITAGKWVSLAGIFFPVPYP